MAEIPITGPHDGFARRLREALQGRRPEPVPITQPAVSTLLHVSTTAARKWLTGEQLPSMSHAVEIAEVCGVCVEWLLTGRGSKQPSTALEDRAADIIRAWPTLSDTEKAAIHAHVFAYRRPA